MVTLRREACDLQFAPSLPGVTSTSQDVLAGKLGSRSIILAEVLRVCRAIPSSYHELCSKPSMTNACVQQAQPVNTSALPFELQFKESYDDIDSYMWSSPEQLVVMFRTGNPPAR